MGFPYSEKYCPEITEASENICIQITSTNVLACMNTPAIHVKIHTFYHEQMFTQLILLSNKLDCNSNKQTQYPEGKKYIIMWIFFFSF